MGQYLPLFYDCFEEEGQNGCGLPSINRNKVSPLPAETLISRNRVTPTISLGFFMASLQLNGGEKI